MAEHLCIAVTDAAPAMRKRTGRRPEVMPYCYAIYVVRLASYGRSCSGNARLGREGRFGQELMIGHQ